MQGPDQIIFHINAACNSACRICRWHKLRLAGSLPTAELTVEDIREVLKMYPGVQHVTLSSLGEPLLHAAFDDVLHEVRLHLGDGNINVITNGSLLHKHLAILDAPGSLNISVDTADKAIHAQMRPGVPLADVVRNLHLVGYLPRNPRRRVGIVMVVTEQTKDSVPSVVALAADAGLDFVAVTRGIGLELSVAPKSEELSAKDVYAVTAQIDAAQAAHTELMVQDFFTNETGNLPSTTYPHCLVPWLAMQVFNDGHVRLCCRAYSVDLGHWSEGAQWGGEKLTRLREQIQERNIDATEFKDCAACPMR